jgi:hypothetical protein
VHTLFTKIASNSIFVFLAVLGGFLILCILFLIIVCIVALIQKILHPQGYESSPKQICKELKNIINGKDPYAWDDFTSIPLKDPRLEAIRMRVAKLDEEFPPQTKGELFGPGGFEVIRGFIRELESELNLPSAG